LGLTCLHTSGIFDRNASRLCLSVYTFDVRRKRKARSCVLSADICLFCRPDEHNRIPTGTLSDRLNVFFLTYFAFFATLREVLCMTERISRKAAEDAKKDRRSRKVFGKLNHYHTELILDNHDQPD